MGQTLPAARRMTAILMRRASELILGRRRYPLHQILYWHPVSEVDVGWTPHSHNCFFIHKSPHRLPLAWRRAASKKYEEDLIQRSRVQRTVDLRVPGRHALCYAYGQAGRGAGTVDLDMWGNHVYVNMTRIGDDQVQVHAVHQVHCYRMQCHITSFFVFPFHRRMASIKFYLSIQMTRCYCY